ncbi:glycosyltransferase family 2 protein [Geomonas oryzisoli]|uniref:Glycosyltransferase family 2 protein n=1 Tax=Geomonas oryzisoli TaxID=2847992 RepID=A0ABX8JHW0_9BACT|nr:glycosyltransferase family 2 protein [Geomonas oryzisoli]QWV95070.1 glycosyltransferase family 2 protein [Geomonas oryzisoli]
MDITAPILFLVFNRPETTRRVFEAIRQSRPSRLFVAADGPRGEVAGERQKCEQVRAIATAVDWECELVTLFRDRNLGCKKGVSSALDWFFSHVEEGIVLEDDCLPEPSFFRYCQELLARYRDDARVMQICGLNVLGEWPGSGHSYFFSGYGPIWGWASWRRAWRHYDVEMKLWPEVRGNGVYRDLCQDGAEAAYRLQLYDRLHAGEIDTWDYQWGFAKMVNSGLSVIPAANLVTNIGFGADATHVSDATDPYAELKVYQADSVLRHPPYLVRDRRADRRYLEEFVGVKPASFREAVLNLVRRRGR